MQLVSCGAEIHVWVWPTPNFYWTYSRTNKWSLDPFWWVQGCQCQRPRNSEGRAGCSRRKAVKRKRSSFWDGVWGFSQKGKWQYLEGRCIVIQSSGEKYVYDRRNYRKIHLCGRQRRSNLHWRSNLLNTWRMLDAVLKCTTPFLTLNPIIADLLWRWGTEHFQWGWVSFQAHTANKWGAKV